MRVGVAGVGRIGRLHARTLTEHPEVTSVAVTDVDSSRAEEVASSVGAEPVKSFAELIGRVDAVVIATTTTSHGELIQAAVDACVPTYCEKPIATDLDSTRAVIEGVQASAVPVQMGFQRRFDPGYQAAAELVASGGLGTLYVVRTAGHDPEPPWEDYIAHSGGIFGTSACTTLTLCDSSQARRSARCMRKAPCAVSRSSRPMATWTRQRRRSCCRVGLWGSCR